MRISGQFIERNHEVVRTDIDFDINIEFTEAELRSSERCTKIIADAIQGSIGQIAKTALKEKMISRFSRKR